MTPHRTTPARAASRRKRIDAIPAKWHCSIIGTCLTLADLRKLAAKARFDLPPDASDYKLHGAVVQWTSRSKVLAKAVQKMLDKRFPAHIARFGRAESEADLARLWDEAVENGDIPGAYWALMSHPMECSALIERAYGEVHMLSHISGATQRADLRRLSRLEARLAERTAEVERLRADLNAAARRVEEAERRAEMADVQRRRTESLEQRVAELESGAVVAEARAARKEAEQARDAADLRAERARMAEQAALRRVEELTGQNQQLLGRVAELELRLRELGRRAAAEPDAPLPAKVDLKRRCILYVGGRSRTAAHLEALVTQCNGEFVYHDGGLEDGCPQLAGAVSRADAVVCPVTCISHEAMTHIKLNCRKACKRFLPLPNHSVSTFMRALRLMDVSQGQGADGEAPC